MTTHSHLTKAFFRMAFLMKMIQMDAEYFLKISNNSGVKNVLKLIKTCLQNNIPRLADNLAPDSKVVFNQQLNVSAEKINALHNMLTKMILLDEASMLALEIQMDEILKVNEG